ncbi:MAG TPA: hypothetical protein VNC60_10655 [Actinomycetota bacterium]|nr:hypothetical protein [Actinomycetota bacterium]
MSPRAIVLVVVGLMFAAGIASFSRWVIVSERRSMEAASKPADIGAIVGTISGADEPASAAAASGRLSIDSTARADIRAALAAARRAATGPATFLDAGPGQRAATGSAMIFVDGPSRAPGVVSVASTRVTWGAAVMGPSGTCYLLRYATGDGATYGAGGVCTGAEALTVTDPSW